MSSAVPEGWVSTTIGEATSEISDGGTPTTSNAEYFNGSIPWVVIDDIQPRIVHTKSSITEVGLQKSSAKLWDKGTIILSTGATIGQVGIAMKAMATKQGICGVVVKSDVSAKYFYHLLVSKKRQLNTLSQGSTIKETRPPTVKKIQICLPPLPEQKKIASILTSVDEVIENTLKQIDKLQDLKKATMNELLTKGIGHTEFKDSELGRIPKSWEARQVQEIAKIIRGASPRPKGDPRYYGGTVPRLMGSDVTRDGKYVFPKTDFLTPEGAKLSRPMSKGGLTIVCSGTVGVPSILGVDACIHDGFLGLVDISNQCTTEFLYYAFLPLQGKFDSSATHGGVFTNLTTEILKEFIIGIPPLGEQREIVRHISSLDEHLNAQINKLSQTQSLKKSLMQDLLTGKVRVTVN
jgi:type I restriction enzyme S subunit